LPAKLLHFTRLTWLHDGAGRSRLLIKNSAHTARVPLLLQLFPRARFVLLQREPIDSVRSLVQVKQSNDRTEAALPDAEPDDRSRPGPSQPHEVSS